jgi:hypothetical protein
MNQLVPYQTSPTQPSPYLLGQVNTGLIPIGRGTLLEKKTIKKIT